MSKKKESQSRFFSVSNELQCSFCGKSIDKVDFVFTEDRYQSNSIICNKCVDLYYDILELQKEENFTETFLKPNLKDFTPKTLYNELNKYVIGQDEAKKILSVAVYNHYKKLNSKDEFNKSNILMIGSTGVGKTLLAKTISKFLKIPMTIVDATVYTQAGYVGEDVENILLSLYQKANNNLKLAEVGIVFIDEIDKISRKGDSPSITRDVSGEGVQNSLLKIIEGTVCNLPPNGGRKHPYEEFIKFDTSKVLFICSGAFEGLENVEESKVGFMGKKTVYNFNVKKLEKYGMIPELLGRLPVVCKLNSLTIDDLVKVLTEPENSIIKEYVNLFLLSNVKLSFTNDALFEIANYSFKYNLGARGLRQVLEKVLMDYLFNIDLYNNKEINITQEEVLSKI